MDTSKEYIKMCDCPEIQKQWESKNGDWYWSDGDTVRKGLPPDEPEIRHIFLDSPTYLYKSRDDELGTWHSISSPKDKKHTWLLRQDQIQEMCKDGQAWKTMPRKFTKRLAEFADSDDYNMTAQTMEQLWLAFYMFEKHKKIWDGKKWVKSETE